MQRSASTGSLAAAGASTLSHIPKRAVQHGIFLSSAEVPPTDLKPGQRSLVRQVYQEEAKPLTETYLNPDRPHDSVYAASHSKLLTVNDFRDRTQKVVQREPPPGFGHHGTAHWKSTSHAFHDESSVSGAQHHRQVGPSYQAANPPTCVSQPYPHSICKEYHGHHGHNPRDRIDPEAKELPVFRTDLTAGTHKGTKHIAGYSGHIALTLSNPHVARVAEGATLRSTDKCAVSEQFHMNLLGYSGHQPLNPANDRGGVKPNTLTNFGRSFVPHDLKAFD